MKGRILIVDDEVDLVDFVGEILNSHGYQTEVCMDGRAAVTTIQSNHYDCIITDLRMPEMNGIELRTWVRNYRPQVSIITMSGTDADDPAFDGELHIRKPFSLAALLHIVDQALAAPTRS